MQHTVTVREREDTNMKSIFDKVETMMAASAFAEEGEFETARLLMNEDTARPVNRQTNHLRPVARPEVRAD